MKPYSWEYIYATIHQSLFGSFSHVWTIIFHAVIWYLTSTHMIFDRQVSMILWYTRDEPSWYLRSSFRLEGRSYDHITREYKLTHTPFIPPPPTGSQGGPQWSCTGGQWPIASWLTHGGSPEAVGVNKKNAQNQLYWLITNSGNWFKDKAW